MTSLPNQPTDGELIGLAELLWYHFQDRCSVQDIEEAEADIERWHRAKAHKEFMELLDSSLPYPELKNMVDIDALKQASSLFYGVESKG